MRLADLALERQEELETWGFSNEGASHIVSMAEWWVQESNLPEPDIDAAVEIILRALGVVFGNIFKADVYAISDEIVDLFTQGAASYTPFELQEEDLPADSGYVWLEKPFEYVDIDGRAVQVNALGWALTMVGPIDGVSDHSSSGVAIAAFGARKNVPDFLQVPYHVATWAFGNTPVDDPLYNAVFGQFLRFLKEPMLEDAPEHASRPVRRRRQRSGLAVSPVRVVKFRHRKSGGGRSDTPGEGAGYSHRFMVRGHWRNQWYPSQQRHAPKWVHPYVKGPEDAPFVPKKTVTVVDQ